MYAPPDKRNKTIIRRRGGGGRGSSPARGHKCIRRVVREDLLASTALRAKRCPMMPKPKDCSSQSHRHQLQGGTARRVSLYRKKQKMGHGWEGERANDESIDLRAKSRVANSYLSFFSEAETHAPRPRPCWPSLRPRSRPSPTQETAGYPASRRRGTPRSRCLP